MTAWQMPRFGHCSRRALLRTGLGALFLAPLLRQRELLAQATAPKRLILAFTPNSHPREWWPTPDGANGFNLRAAGFPSGVVDSTSNFPTRSPFWTGMVAMYSQ